MIEFLMDGGPFMLPLGACLILALSVMLERYIVLKEVREFAIPFLKEFNDCISNGDLQQARDLCAEHPHPVSHMLRAGLERHDEVRQEENIAFIHEHVDDAVSNAGMQTIGLLEKRLGLLASISNLAPLFGFAGTVTGMIVAFGAIASAGNVDVSQVAEGISQALNTTASGLVIGIIATIGHNYFSSKIEDFVEYLEDTTNGMLAQLIQDIMDQRYSEEAMADDVTMPPPPPSPEEE